MNLPPIKDSVGFTGTRTGMSTDQLQLLKEYLVKFYQTGLRWLHHGDCVGADEQAHTVAVEVGFLIAGHPPVNPVKRAWKTFDFTYKEADYLERNRSIVESSACLVATPRSMKVEVRSGTWYTVRYARRVGKPLYVLSREIKQGSLL